MSVRLGLSNCLFASGLLKDSSKSFKLDSAIFAPWSILPCGVALKLLVTPDSLMSKLSRSYYLFTSPVNSLKILFSAFKLMTLDLNSEIVDSRLKFLSWRIEIYFLNGAI